MCTACAVITVVCVIEFRLNAVVVADSVNLQLPAASLW